MRSLRMMSCLLPLLVAGVALGAEEKPATDALGDPLPAGTVARLGTTRLWHEGTRAVSFARYGKELVTLGGRREGDKVISSLRWWNTTDGKLLRERRFPPGFGVTAWTATPDGRRLVLGVDDEQGRRRIALWDVERDKEIDGPLMAHIWPITFLSILPDGKTLVSRDDSDRSFHCWDLAERKEVKKVEPPPQGGRHYTINDSALSLDGKRSAWYVKSYAEDQRGGPGAVNGESIQVMEDGKIIYQQKGPFEGLVHLALSPDGRRLAWATDRKSPRVIDVDRGDVRVILPLDRGYSDSLTFSPDGKTLVCRVGAHPPALRVQLWDVERPRALSSLAAAVTRPNWNAPLTISADGRKIAVCADDCTRLYEVATGKECLRLPGHRTSVLQLAYAPDGGSLLSRDKGFACRWKRAPGGQHGFRSEPEVRSRLEVARADRKEDRESADGDRNQRERIPWPIYSLDATRKLDQKGTILNTTSSRRRKVSSLECEGNEYYWSGFFSPDNRKLLLYRLDRDAGYFNVFDVDSGKRSGHWPSRNCMTAVFSPDCRLVVWQEREQGKLVVADLRTGKLLKQPTLDLSRKPFREASALMSYIPNVPAHTWRFSAVTISPDGRRLAAVWNSTLAADASPELMIRPQYKEPTTLYIWDIDSGKELSRIAFERPPAPARAPGIMDMSPTWPQLTCLAFSRDGRTLAAGYLNDSDVHLLEAASGRQRAVLHGHAKTVRSLALSPDGRYLASGSDDATILVWDMDQWAKGTAPTHPSPLTAEEGHRLWNDLASTDAAVAFRAMQRLRQSPTEAVKLLGERLRPAPAVPDERIRRLIEELDSEQFAVRDRAARELKQLAELAEPALAKALENRPSLETRRRLQELVEFVRAPVLPPERLRSVRGVEVLESIAGAEATAHLQVLASGAAPARLTQEAKDALRRLKAVR